jgi:catechol 2,3-dioxygenase-like lactoylglutathione lyase family enzyme
MSDDEHQPPRGRVEGIGGIFFRAQDPDALRAWYVQHLGLPALDGATGFWWRHDREPERRGHTVWAPFDSDTDYFGDGATEHERPADWMINYRVDDLDAVLDRLRSEGVTVDERVEESRFGRFGWALDPEGHRFELWQPPPGQ